MPGDPTLPSSHPLPPPPGHFTLPICVPTSWVSQSVNGLLVQCQRDRHKLTREGQTPHSSRPPSRRNFTGAEDARAQTQNYKKNTDKPGQFTHYDRRHVENSRHWHTTNDSGITKVGVTRCGNWLCQHFLPYKVTTFFHSSLNIHRHHSRLSSWSSIQCSCKFSRKVTRLCH